LAPENTLAAMRKGLEFGFRAVEFDVMLAADRVPVLMHDATFGRTVPAPGATSLTPSTVLLGMDAGAWFGPAWRGEPVPLFAAIVQYCRQHGIWMNIEIKPAPGFERITGEAVGLLTRALYADQLARTDGPEADVESQADLLPLFSSFSVEALESARQSAPQIPRGLLFDDVPSDWRAQFDDLDCVSLHCNHSKLTAETARQVGSAGYGLLCYTVNSVERASLLFGWGVDAICTDRLDLFAQG